MSLPAPTLMSSSLEVLLEQCLTLDAKSPEVEALAAQVKALAKEKNDTEALAKSLFVLGKHGVATENFAEAKEALEQALLHEEFLGAETQLESLCLLITSTSNLGLYDVTIPLATKALEQSRHLHNLDAELDLLPKLAAAYYHLGLHQEALGHYLTRLEHLGGSDSRSLSGVANIYWRRGDFSQALSYYERALELARHSQDKFDEGIALCNMANCYEDLEKMGEALHYRLAAQAVFDDCKSHRHSAVNLGNLGNFYTVQGEYSKALHHFELALQSLQLSPEQGTEGWLYLRLGYTYLKQQNFAAALKHLHDSLAITERVNALEDLYEAHEYLSETYEALGDTRNALEHYKAFHNYKEQVFNEHSSQQTKTMMMQFDVERTKQEQAITHLKNVELAKVVQQLEELSQRDGLTGLFNRRYLDQRLEQAFEDARLVEQPLSVLISDIDHFKKINDHFSHAVGDDVLKIVAAIYKDNVWGADIVARYGGEEFVVVFRNTELEQAHHVAEKLRQKIEQYPWHELRPELRVTVSMGLSDDMTVSGFEKLLSLADDKLYEAKRGGRNQVRS
jgi:diguanylate cyclase (GGDEF)-like protein